MHRSLVLNFCGLKYIVRPDLRFLGVVSNDLLKEVVGQTGNIKIIFENCIYTKCLQRWLCGGKKRIMVRI